MAAALVEVDAGRDRHAGRVQQLAAEGDRVGREVADVDVEVEGAVGGRHPAEAGAPQGGDQAVPVRPVAGDAAVQLRLVVEGAQGRVLGDGRGRDEEVLGQPLDRPDQGLGQHQPAEPPAGHAEILGEAVDQDGLGRHAEHGARPLLVGDAVIDLVDDEAKAASGGRRRRGPRGSAARSMVPVGLAGLATIRPCERSAPAPRSRSAVGWKRSAASTGSGTTSTSSARRMLR